MEIYRSRRKLFAPKPCVAAGFSHKVPLFPSRRKFFPPKPCVTARFEQNDPLSSSRRKLFTSKSCVTAQKAASHYSCCLRNKYSALLQFIKCRPNPSPLANLNPRTNPSPLTKQPPHKSQPSPKPSLRSKSQPPRTTQPSHKAASANPLGFVRAGCFESPAPLSGRRWCVPKLKSGRLSYSPTTSPPRSHISYPSSLPLHNTVPSVCTSLTPPLQIPSNSVAPVAFSLQFYSRYHLSVLSQHRYICVFWERGADIHLYNICCSIRHPEE